MGGWKLQFLKSLEDESALFACFYENDGFVFGVGVDNLQKVAGFEFFRGEYIILSEGADSFDASVGRMFDKIDVDIEKLFQPFALKLLINSRCG